MYTYSTQVYKLVYAIIAYKLTVTPDSTAGTSRISEPSSIPLEDSDPDISSLQEYTAHARQQY